jgi:hypothetical protein
MSHAVVWVWASMGLYAKPAQCSMGLDKPVTKCDGCERGEPRKPNISILYAEIGSQQRLEKVECISCPTKRLYDNLTLLSWSWSTRL